MKGRAGFNHLFWLEKQGAWAGLLFTVGLERIGRTSTKTENLMQEDHAKNLEDIEARIDQLRGFL
ncbi:MAG: hypothetical protein VW455_06440 [Nitrospinota bacterium]